MDDPRSALPAVSTVLEQLVADSRLGPDHLATVVREVIELLRVELASGGRHPATTAGTGAEDGGRTDDDLLAEAVTRVGAREDALLAGPTRAINATGVLLHTGLGRAPLSDRARAAVSAASGAHTVELDGDGRRGHRDDRPAELVRLLTGAEDATFANNGAGALVLALRAVAAAGTVAVSRGELIEIGGSFRLPDVVAAAGVDLHEIGTTNRTHLRDVEAALDAGVDAVLVVHPSNYSIDGFVTRPNLPEIVDRAHAAGAAVVHDVGSGLIDRPGDRPADSSAGPGATEGDDADDGGRAPGGAAALADEPTIHQSVVDGVDLVTASADKLLGGPQAGLVVGRRAAVARARRDPLARALRLDKLRVAGLVATLQDHLAGGDLPVRRLLSTRVATLRARAEDMVAALAHRGVTAEVVAAEAVVGGGSVPGQRLPSIALALPAWTATALRDADPPVLARVAHDRCLLDLRTVLPADDADLVAAVATVATTGAPATSPRTTPDGPATGRSGDGDGPREQ